MNTHRRLCRWAAPILAAALVAACTTLRPETDLRAYRIEQAVVPMARAALAAGQVETARRLYTRLLDVAPDAVDARMGLGDVALATSQPARAATWYLGAARVAEDADARHAALLAHGRASIAAGDLDAARGSLERLVSPDEGVDATNAAWGHNGLAVVAMLEGDPLRSLAAIEQARLLDPDEPRFRDNLARATAIVDAHRSQTETPARAGSGLAHADIGPAPTRIPDTPAPLDGRPPDRRPALSARGDSAPQPTDDLALVQREPETETARTSPAEDSSVDSFDSGLAAASAARPSPTAAKPTDGDQGPALRGDHPVAAQESVPAETGPPPGAGNKLPRSPLDDAGPELVLTAAAVDDAGPTAPAPQSVAKAPPSVAEDPAISSPARRLAVPAAAPAADAPAEGAQTPTQRQSAAEIRRVAVAGFIVAGPSGHYLQAGAFAVEANARHLAERLSQVTDLPVAIEPPRGDQRGLHRVRIGPLPPPVEWSSLIDALRGYAGTQARRPAKAPGTGHKVGAAS